jgi:hypothetical protein
LTIALLILALKKMQKDLLQNSLVQLYSTLSHLKQYQHREYNSTAIVDMALKLTNFRFDKHNSL